MTLRKIFASLMTEDKEDEVPDWSRIMWFCVGVLLLLGIAMFFVLAVVVAVAVLRGLPDRLSLLRVYAESFCILFAGAGASMGLCAAALAIKTKSGA